MTCQTLTKVTSCDDCYCFFVSTYLQNKSDCHVQKQLEIPDCPGDLSKLTRPSPFTGLVNSTSAINLNSEQTKAEFLQLFILILHVLRWVILPKLD